MEVIEVSSYTENEKFHIAKEHLLKKQLVANGMEKGRLKIADKALKDVIRYYTREAGVRELERKIGTICRKAAREYLENNGTNIRVNSTNLTEYLGIRKYSMTMANKKNEVGIVRGLAWTAVGGEMLQVEVALMEGTGKLELTGSLGDVMKESARIAISCVRTLAPKLSIDGEFYKKLDIHIHVPEGAVPKDGPSAGVTLTTALVSALTDNPVRGDVAMTGEVTLRGRVLPIGGLREKAMAAYTHKMKTVLIPKGNAPHVAEVDEAVKAGLEFVPVESILQVLQTALVHPVGAPQNEGK
jgi:ATP-dependent Lon protease